MSSVINKFNSFIPLPVRLLLVVAVGLSVAYSGVFAPLMITGWAVGMKLQGRAPHCPWAGIVGFYPGLDGLSELMIEHEAALRVEDYDPSFGIELISNPTTKFWIRRHGTNLGGVKLLAFLLADHEWIASRIAEKGVRKGDVVLDCGAHVGVFTRKALELGAEKVIAIDPDPTQVECLRRNFVEEIASGRVVVAPKAVWSSEGTMSLSIGALNSGRSSLVKERAGERVEVPLTTIDKLVEELNLPRVDYLKLDIEGAEREALKGATETLRRHRPRVLIDSYHRPDDMAVLPAIITGANHGYRPTCGWCEPSKEFVGQIVPHYVLYE